MLIAHSEFLKSNQQFSEAVDLGMGRLLQEEERYESRGHG